MHHEKMKTKKSKNPFPVIFNMNQQNQQQYSLGIKYHARGILCHDGLMVFTSSELDAKYLSSVMFGFNKNWINDNFPKEVILQLKKQFYNYFNVPKATVCSLYVYNAGSTVYNQLVEKPYYLDSLHSCTFHFQKRIKVVIQISN